MKQKLIEPRILKGFRDYLPREMIHRRRMIAALEQVFCSFGFVPIDTPALEFAEILLGKGSAETDKQLYRFLDNGERDVALRFDLTVPLARFVAQHKNELGVPFKRYHIAPVWRAEKPQRGRYREFYQCDFDIIGTRSVYADAEIVGVISGAMQTLGINYKIRVNNRLILNGLLESVGAQGKSVAVLRAIDKLEKVGQEAVAAELRDEAGLSSEQSVKVFSFLALQGVDSTSAELFSRLRTLLADSDMALLGVDQLQTLLHAAEAFGVTASTLVVDLSIARGLDYYTGTVFETTCLDLPSIGSICSGGRYDNLASLYTNEDLPGVGASVGLDRILGALEELGRLEGSDSTAEVLVTVVEAEAQQQCCAIAQSLRAAGVPTETYPDVKKLAHQLKYADRKRFKLVIIAGTRELERGVIAIKILATGEQHEVPLSSAVSEIRKLITYGSK